VLGLVVVFRQNPLFEVDAVRIFDQIALGQVVVVKKQSYFAPSIL
jgi:hypothetical protein